MNRSTLGLVIGGLNVTIYILASFYYIYALVQIGHIEDSSESHGFEIGIRVFMLVLCLIMILVSVLLIMGINKQRSKLMAPWVYLTIAEIVLNILQLVTSGFKSSPNNNVFLTIIIIAIQILLWYPIYTLYKDISSENITGSPSAQYNQQNVIASPNASYPSAPTYGQLPQKE